jgi:hypothetical protein
MQVISCDTWNRIMNFFAKAYAAIGSVTCAWFLMACLFGWRAPNFGIINAMNSGSTGGRSTGIFWGGGK